MPEVKRIREVVEYSHGYGEYIARYDLLAPKRGVQLYILSLVGKGSKQEVGRVRNTMLLMLESAMAERGISYAELMPQDLPKHCQARHISPLPCRAG